MDAKFPVLDVAKASLMMPLESLKNIFKGIGLIVLAVVVGLTLMALIMFMAGVNAETFANAEGALDAGDYEALMALGTGFLFGMLFLIFAVVLAAAHIFNYWVRFAAYGKDGAQFDTAGGAFKAALINAVKFMLIGILIMIASVVLQAVLSALGLTDSFTEQMTKAAEGDIAGQIKDGFLATLLSTIVTCIIYSLFSANLTQTAVGTEKEGLEHPHTMDFAIVLVLLYAVLLVPLFLASLIGSVFLISVIQYVIGLYIIFAIAASHGLRYRICVHQKEEGDDTALPA